MTSDFLSSIAQIKPLSAEDYRRATLHTDVYPMLARWGYEERYRHELASWHSRQRWAFDFILDKFRNVGAIVALVGIRGVGKTTISAQFALRHAWQNYEDSIGEGVAGRLVVCRHAKASALVSRFKPVYADFGSIDAERLSDARDYLCRNIEFLTIDELHETQDMKLRDRLLSDILDRRYSALRDTLLISNQTPEQFRETTPDSVLSRLEEHGAIVPCEWPSWRKQ